MADVQLRKRMRVLIVDDHALVRRGLAELIEREPDLEVCGEAVDADEAMQQVEAVRPDLVIIDLSLKSGHGINLIKQIRTNHKNVKMLVSSMHDESLFAERAVRAGALGYISKDQPTETVLQAIRQVLRGQLYLSSQMTSNLLGRAVDGKEIAERSPLECLSDRELEVFQRIGQGQTTRQIAADLDLSVKTIETYREHIKKKLNLKNSAELNRHAVQWVLENS